MVLAQMLPGKAIAASDGSADTADHPPIQTKMNLGLFGLLGSNMEYRMGDRKLESFEDFKKAIYPLNDEEASKLIREAEEDHFVASMFYVAGVATGVDVALVFNPTPFVHVDWIDRIATGAVVLQFFAVAGALFDLNAGGRKYNAVQRYNGLVRKEEDAFLGIAPRLALRSDGLGLAVTSSF